MIDKKTMFTLFEGVRKSGVINMWDAKTGCEITGLTKEEWLFVISNYDELYDEFHEQK